MPAALTGGGARASAQLREEFDEPRWLAANGRVHSGPFLWLAPPGHYEFMRIPTSGSHHRLAG